MFRAICLVLALSAGIAATPAKAEWKPWFVRLAEESGKTDAQRAYEKSVCAESAGAGTYVKSLLPFGVGIIASGADEIAVAQRNAECRKKVWINPDTHKPVRIAK